VVDGIAAAGPEPKTMITFFPTSGEPLNYRDTGVSASTAAGRLAQIFRADAEHRALSLHGVAVRIPADLDHHGDAIRQFMSKCKDYERIFASETGLMLGVQAIITGVGDVASSEQDPLFQETREAENLP
jgi:hypothetical protein